MSRALELALRGPVGPNPRVGAVVLDDEGRVVGEGWHEGAGTVHAEVAALAQAESSGGGTGAAAWKATAGLATAASAIPAPIPHTSVRAIRLGR